MEETEAWNVYWICANSEEVEKGVVQLPAASPRKQKRTLTS